LIIRVAFTTGESNMRKFHASPSRNRFPEYAALRKHQG
jgi:hypothetical protein